MESALRIQTLYPEDDWALVRAFWYNVYVMEMKKQISHADHSKAQLEDITLQDGQIHCVFSGAELVATLRRNMVTELHPNSAQWSDFRLDSLKKLSGLSKVSYSSKLIVSAEYRSSTIMARLVSHAYANACEIGLQIDLLYCLPRLVPLYKRLGFLTIPGSRYQKGVGVLIPMALLLNDIEYLKGIRSPLCRYYKGTEMCGKAKEAFYSVYSDSVGVAVENSAAYAEVTLAGLIEECWDGAEVVPAKQTLSPDYWKELKAFGVTFRVAEQEVIIGEGEPSSHLYLVLSGSIEVESTINGKPRTLSVLGPGHVFGESSLAAPHKSTDTVRAITEVEVLSLNSESLQKKTAVNLEGQLLLLAIRAMVRRNWLLKKEIEVMHDGIA